MKTLSLYLLLHHWVDYDNRKLEQGQDPGIFNPREQWEVAYLANRIQKMYPEVPESSIYEAIDIIASTGAEDRQRKLFIHRVLVQLSLYDQQTTSSGHFRG